MSTYQHSTPQFMNKRSCGVFMPIFSLPSPYGIGTMGTEAFNFVDFLERSGVSFWQVLPLGHTGFGNSPYQCFSSVAGNPYFIDLDMLVRMSLIHKEDIPAYQSSDPSRVDYSFVESTKMQVLRKAFQNSSEWSKQVQKFYNNNLDWLPDYALFMALKDYFDKRPIWEWSDSKAIQRDPEALNHYKALLSEDIDFYVFLQYLFSTQWYELKSYANTKGIQIIGDIPMYPSPDSCDVWCSPEFFKVDEHTLKPTGIAGVPPDAFSEDGQVWGNPVYLWNIMRTTNYSWWVWRLRHAFELFDVVRIDHFRAFQDYFQIPAGETTAKNGFWVAGPRMEFFNRLRSEFGELPLILEDLGIIGDDVRSLRDATGCPGMKVMIFGFNSWEDCEHAPHNWGINCVGYTSTHDSATLAERYDSLSEEDRMFANAYLNFPYSSEEYKLHQASTVVFACIRSALASPARLVIFPMADFLSLKADGCINIPSTVGDGNWSWRLSPRDVHRMDWLAKHLAFLLRVFRRTRY